MLVFIKNGCRLEIIVTNLLAFKFRIGIEEHIDVPQRTIPNESKLKTHIINTH